ncbi:MAG: DUF1877 family protein [Bacillota bacterium]|nr:DUF1877 family protein [Bacillota bacterium]
MLMTWNYLMVEEELVKGWDEGKIQASEIFIMPDSEGGTIVESEEYMQIDLVKDWYTVHHLTFAPGWEDDRLLIDKVLGGICIRELMAGTRTLEFLTPSEVKKAYDNIKDITAEDLYKRADWDKILKINKYPQFKRVDDFQYIADFFTRQKDFYRRAAESGKAILIY